MALGILFLNTIHASAGEPQTDPSLEAEYPEIEAGIELINKYGNILLTISGDSMRELGYEPADVVFVTIGDAEMEMPIGTSYTDVDPGEPICCFKTDSESGKEVVLLAINSGNLTTALGIAQVNSIEEDPGYEWIFSEGFDESTSIYISMDEKQGYAEEYALHELGNTRTNNRDDYATLSDAEYANFRAIETTGMGTDTLFRSSSPIDPALNRNEEADEALLACQVRTIMNMADSEGTMKTCADYSLSAYSDCDIIALDMSVDFSSDEYTEKLAEGFRFLASNEGPYLIHCKEGKDRTGFAAGVLECLMGADVEEIVKDYMLSYYNFYGIEPGSDQWEQIGAGCIEKYLAQAFGIDSIRAEGTDLQACAQEYLIDIGMNEQEISDLKENLSRDYGGKEF